MCTLTQSRATASAIFINYQHKKMLAKNHKAYTSVNNAANKQIEFTKRYPIPAFAMSGLFVGSFFHWPLYQPILGQWIWFITLIVGHLLFWILSEVACVGYKL